MNKKASHVGVILSFVIFVTFLIFLYSILEPTIDTDKDKQGIMRYLKTELIALFSEDVIVVIVGEDEENLINGEACYNIPKKDLQLENYDDLNFVVKTRDGSLVKANKQADNFQIELVGEEIFEIYFSLANLEGSEGGDCNEGVVPEIRNVAINEFIFASKIDGVGEEYGEFESQEYFALKEKLRINVGTEFGFKFLDDQKVMILQTQEEILATNIYSEELPIQYMDDQAEIKQGFLRVFVW
jgi:hypothetical protein